MTNIHLISFQLVSEVTHLIAGGIPWPQAWLQPRGHDFVLLFFPLFLPILCLLSEQSHQFPYLHSFSVHTGKPIAMHYTLLARYRTLYCCTLGTQQFMICEGKNLHFIEGILELVLLFLKVFTHGFFECFQWKIWTFLDTLDPDLHNFSRNQLHHVPSNLI
jgi:hypothetical protein